MFVNKRVTGALLFGSLTAAIPLLTNCGQLKDGAVPSAPGGGGSCPSDPTAIMNANFGLKPELESQLKASLSASAHLQALSARVEGDVVTACSGLAKDLGASDADLAPTEEGPGKKAEAACTAAVKLIEQTKAKAQGELVVEVQPPRCSASMEAYADCAASCDATVEPGQVNVQCEEGKLSGTCEGECEGTCVVEAAGKCEGQCGATCTGSCEAGFSGNCGGKCEGTCDGKDVSGKCAGTCSGSCSAQAEGTCTGTCKGECSGGCEVEAKGECKGTCRGGCSVEMKAPECSGDIEPANVSAECDANCDAKAEAEVECTPATVAVIIKGSADAQAAEQLRTALSNNLPLLLKVSMGMKDSAVEVAGSVQGALEGVKATLSSDANTAMKVGPCIAAALKAQAEASASISVSVKASASASGSASAG